MLQMRRLIMVDKRKMNVDFAGYNDPAQAHEFGAPFPLLPMAREGFPPPPRASRVYDSK